LPDAGFWTERERIVIVRLGVWTCVDEVPSLETSHGAVARVLASLVRPPRHSTRAMPRMSRRWPGWGARKGNVHPVSDVVPGPPAWNQPESPPAPAACQAPSCVE
jgi:hypothetical protein